MRYALVGAVAMAFYAEARFTRDIDLLVDSSDFEKTKSILGKEGYFESAAPWTFRNVAIELHRFLKVTPEDEEDENHAADHEQAAGVGGLSL